MTIKIILVYSIKTILKVIIYSDFKFLENIFKEEEELWLYEIPTSTIIT